MDENPIVMVEDNEMPIPEVWEETPPNLSLSVDERVEVMATDTALKHSEIVADIVDKKAQELGAKAYAKVINAHASLAKAEVEKIATISEKSKAFFQANKQVLGIIGIKEELGYRTMSALYPLALTLFLMIALVIYFPISVISYIVEFFIKVIGSISKQITSSGLRILLSILICALIVGLLFGIYFGITLLFVNI